MSRSARPIPRLPSSSVSAREPCRNTCNTSWSDSGWKRVPPRRRVRWKSRTVLPARFHGGTRFNSACIRRRLTFSLSNRSRRTRGHVRTNRPNPIGLERLPRLRSACWRQANRRAPQLLKFSRRLSASRFSEASHSFIGLRPEALGFARSAQRQARHRPAAGRQAAAIFGVARVAGDAPLR